MTRRLLQLLLVSIAVALNLLSAIILKEAADLKHSTALIIMSILTLLVVLNLLRVLLWGAIHRRFPLSDSYPLTSIFFPMILVISALRYEEPITWGKIVGTLFIVLGIVVHMIHSDRVTICSDKLVEPEA